MLSTSAGTRWPTEEEIAVERDWYTDLPQAIYSTDGGVWTVTELGDRKINQLRVSGNLLYSLSTTEGADGAVAAEYLTSSDGGKSWDGTALPFGALTPDAAFGGHASEHSTYQLVTSDNVQLAVRMTYWDLDYDWLSAQFDLAQDQWPEIVGATVVVRDWSQCNLFYEELNGDQERQVAELIGSGMAEDDARIQVYGDEGSDSYAPTTTVAPADEAVASDSTTPPTTVESVSAESTFIVGGGEPVEPPECSDPPVIQEKSLAELGLAGFNGGTQTTITALRSTDGQTWTPAEVPGDYVYAAGSVFLSEDYPDQTINGDIDPAIAEESGYLAPTVFVSTDGLNWTETDATEQGYYREMKASLNGKFSSFTARYDEPTASETQADGTYLSRGELIFGQSSDGISWSDTVIASFADTESGSTWPLIQEVGPLGVLVVLQHADYSQQAEESGPDDYSYDRYFDTISYTVRYSQDGVTWQTVDVEAPPRSQITWGFVTGDAIGLTYQTGMGQGVGQTKTSTILLTPER
ncbi:MAG: hypothetical protein R2706_00475 [Acidimicrobiales bacterium]